MKRFFNFYKPFSKEDITLVGGHISKNIFAYLGILALVAIFEVVMLIRGVFIFDFDKLHHFLYFISYVVLFGSSVALMALIWIFKKHEKKDLIFYNLLWIYSFILFAWSFLVSYIDMGGDHSPIVYLTIMATVSGVVLLNPIIYNCTLIPSVIALFVVGGISDFPAMKTVGDYLNIIVFVVMAIIVNIRLYKVSKVNYEEKIQLDLSNITDSLTGLGNGNKYFRWVHDLEEDIAKGKNPDFFVVMMDVNNLKYTNDKFGHIYGTHLIKEAGRILPTIFESSNIFHVGGDEFIAIVDHGKDYDNFDGCLKAFQEQLECKMINYLDVDMPLSLAIGCAKFENGMKFSEVLHKADTNMYINKTMIKEKYHFENR